MAGTHPMEAVETMSEGSSERCMSGTKACMQLTTPITLTLKVSRKSSIEERRTVLLKITPAFAKHAPIRCPGSSRSTAA